MTITLVFIDAATVWSYPKSRALGSYAWLPRAFGVPTIGGKTVLLVQNTPTSWQTSPALEVNPSKAAIALVLISSNRSSNVLQTLDYHGVNAIWGHGEWSPETWDALGFPQEAGTALVLKTPTPLQPQTYGYQPQICFITTLNPKCILHDMAALSSSYNMLL